MKARFAWFLILAAVLLSACSQKTNITFYRNQSWNLSTKVHYEERLMDLFGNVITSVVGSEVGLSIPSVTTADAMSLLDMLFDSAKPDYKAKGITLSWHHASGTYTLGFRGTSIGQFNQVLPQIAQIEDLGNNEYHLTMAFTKLGDLDPGLQDMETYTNSLFQNTVTLHVGRIISGTADEVHGGNATWYNPSQIDVVFTPASMLSPGIILAFGGLAILGVIIGVISNIRKQRLQVENDEFPE